MKKLLLFSIVLLLGSLALVSLDKYKLASMVMVGLKSGTASSTNSSLSGINGSNISTPGPLRASEDNPGAQLTSAGVFYWTNENRRQNGSLPPLRENDVLDAMANSKLKDMFDQQYFEHISPDGKGPAQLANQFHYDYVMIGENLALGNFKNDEGLLTAWMNSPGHRANILNTRYDEIGIAVGKGMFEGRETWLAVQEFGKPKSDCPAINPSLKAQIDSLNSDIKDLNSSLQMEKAKLDSMNPKSQAEIDSYNQEVANYNNLVHIFNNKLDQVKELTNLYNSQVAAFNLCAQN